MPTFDPVFFFSKTQKNTVSCIIAVNDLLRKAQAEAFIEISLRFHKFGIRCFKNLLTNCRVRKNTRVALKKRRRKVLSLCFTAFMVNLTRSISEDITTSVAMQLINETRSARLDKFARRRMLTDKIIAHREKMLVIEREKRKEILAERERRKVDREKRERAEYEKLKVRKAVSTKSTEVSRPGTGVSSDGGSRPTTAGLPMSRPSTARIDGAESFASLGSNDGASLPSAKVLGIFSDVGQSLNEANATAEPVPTIDLLYWDREDREIMLASSQQLTKHSIRLAAMTKFCAEVLARGDDFVITQQVLLSEIKLIIGLLNYYYYFP